MQKNTFDKIHHPFRKKISQQSGIERIFHNAGKGTHDRSVVNTMLRREKQKIFLLIPAQAMMLTLSTVIQYSVGSSNQSN